jgi:cobyrinic acid a,c-diamide synthase
MVKERYLGLHMPGEEGVPTDYLERLAELLEKSVDMDAVLEVARSAQIPAAAAADAVPRPVPAPADALTIAVAQDAAFGFYYQE